MSTIYKYVQDNNIKTPIQLEIGLDKVIYKGRQTRYLTAKINGENVTRMVAEATGLSMSHANDTPNSLIIHGGGMDMFFALQTRMYSAACHAGYPDMFDKSLYKDLGKKKGRKYEYEK